MAAAEPLLIGLEAACADAPSGSTEGGVATAQGRGAQKCVSVAVSCPPPAAGAAAKVSSGA